MNKATFSDPLHTEAVGAVSGVTIDRVTFPFNFSWPIGDSSFSYWMVIIPSGFITDYATIPPWAQKVFGLKPNDPDFAQAAVLHDWLCQRRKKLLLSKNTGQIVKEYEISRKEADDIFLLAMRALNCPEWKSKLLYAAVRAYATVTFKF